MRKVITLLLAMSLYCVKLLGRHQEDDYDELAYSVDAQGKGFYELLRRWRRSSWNVVAEQFPTRECNLIPHPLERLFNFFSRD